MSAYRCSSALYRPAGCSSSSSPTENSSSSSSSQASSCAVRDPVDILSLRKPILLHVYLPIQATGCFNCLHGSSPGVQSLATVVSVKRIQTHTKVQSRSIQMVRRCVVAFFLSFQLTMFDCRASCLVELNCSTSMLSEQQERWPSRVNQHMAQCCCSMP